MLDRNYRYLVIASLAVFLLSLSIFKISNQDTYLHLKAGEYILQNAKIPYVDPFSYTASGKAWVYHEWLFAVLIYAIYSIGSLEVLSLITAILIFITFMLLFSLIRRQGGNSYLAALIVIAVFLGSRFFFSLRPHQLSYLFIVLFLFVLNRYEEERRSIWLLPLLIIPWANIHAGCIYGLALIGMYIVGNLIDEGIKKKTKLLQSQRQLIIILISSLVASLINPYTYRALTYPWEIMQLNTSQFTISVVEWRPTTFTNYPYFFILLPILGFLFLFNYRRVKMTEVLLVLVFGFWGARVERAVGEFFLVTAPILGRHGQIFIDEWLKPATSRMALRSWRIGNKFITLSVNLLFSGSIVYLAAISIERHGAHQWGLGMNDEMVPVQAVRFLNEAGIGGNMYNSYDLGGYLIWLSYPERLVFVDGRHDVHADYLRDAAYLSYEDLFQRLDVNYLVLRNARVAGEIPPKNKWGLVYWGDVGRVYLRRKPENQGLLNRYEYRFIQPDQADFSYLNPYIKDQMGREELIKELNRSIASDRNNLNAHVTLAYVYKNSGGQYLDGAISEYEKAIEMRPDEAFLHNSLGVMYKKTGKMTEAKKEWEKAVRLDPNYLPAYGNLRDMYLATGDEEKARQYENRYRQLKEKR